MVNSTADSSGNQAFAFAGIDDYATSRRCARPTLARLV
jgi:hypothetical protein